MPFPTIVEKYGSLSATGFAKEVTFGTPVAATTFLPMVSNTMEEDPGWFSPHDMQGLRDLQIYNLYGEAKFSGTINGPLFPSNAMAVMVAAIGADNIVGAGITGTGSTSATTISAGVTAGTSVATVAAIGTIVIGSIVQLDVNGTGPVTTAEVRKVTGVAGSVLTVDQAWTYAHLSAAPIKIVTAPFTHTIQQQNSLPSLTVEKNVGSFQSLQFAGCRVNKFEVKCPTGNSAVDVSVELMGQSVAVLNSPTAINVTQENPYVFSEATLSIFGGARTEVSNVSVTIENGVKETYTFSSNTGPSYLTPVTLHVMGSIDLVWSSFNDATYGDFTKMQNGTLGALVFTLTHPSNGGTITFSCPQIVLAKFTQDIKMEDVVLSALTFEASRPLTGNSQYSIQATVTNSVYLPY